MNAVAVLKSESRIIKVLNKGIDAIGGFRSVFSPVLVKPNICTISDNTGYSVTDVSIVEAIIHLLLQHDESLTIKIVESDSQSKYADEAFEKFGYTGLANIKKAEGYDVSVVNLTKSEMKQTEFAGLYFNKPELPAEILSEHYYISVAVPKTHYLTFITGSLKNQFGLLPRKDMSVYHSEIDDIIVDLNRIVKPDLCIFDARVGVERWNGPKTHSIGLFVVGDEPVATDAVMARIMGFNPESITHIQKAGNHGLGTLNPKIIGEKIEDVIVKFKSPK